jgi:hypothetical protein
VTFLNLATRDARLIVLTQFSVLINLTSVLRGEGLSRPVCAAVFILTCSRCTASRSPVCARVSSTGSPRSYVASVV